MTKKLPWYVITHKPKWIQIVINTLVFSIITSISVLLIDQNFNVKCLLISLPIAFGVAYLMWYLHKNMPKEEIYK